MLTRLGFGVEVFESSAVVGGHSRSSEINGVVYEPEGPHIFHTSDPEVANWVQALGLNRPFEHKVRTRIQSDPHDPGLLLSWPPQIEELSQLAEWPQIETELLLRPDVPEGENFEDYVISLMGRTLYELFVKGYTIKQWGRDPKELSSVFAPKRVDIRGDGDRRLFHDEWEFFPREGMNPILEAAARRLTIHLSSPVSAETISELESEYETIVITAPLDDFVGSPGELEWRGIQTIPRFVEVGERETHTEAYQINHPSLEVPFTRTIETKHATGQVIRGTVVCEEMPGSPDRHYPVPTVDRRNEILNSRFKEEIEGSTSLTVKFCGRLSNYTYINQDQAIAQGFKTAREIAAAAGRTG